MLLVKLLLFEYNKQSIETKVDLYNTIRDGYFNGDLSISQIRALILWSGQYTPIEISAALLMDEQAVKDMLCAAFRYLENKTHYSDYNVIRSSRGTVTPEQLARCEHYAKEEWNFD